jgi:hemolysin activation/secretion protein
MCRTWFAVTLLTCAACGMAAPVRADVPAASPTAEDAFDIFEFRVLGNSTLDARDIESAVYPYLGEHKTLATVEQARDALVEAYRKAGLGTVLVDIPEQTVDDGIVRLQVTEGRIEKVRIAGARYYSERKILASLPSIQAGSVPKLPTFQQELTELANEARDRQIVPVLKPGSTPGTVEVDLSVQDRLPLHASLQVDNRYTADTSPLRVTASVSYENLFQRAETVSLMVQTSPQDTSQVKLGVLSYAGHTPWKAVSWSGYAIRSDSNVAAVGTLAVIGKGSIYGLRLNRDLSSGASGVLSLALGADYKNFGENIRLSNDSLATPIRYLMWTAQLSDVQRTERYDLQANLSAQFGIRGLLNDERQFEYKRANAHAGFSYLRGSAQAFWHLPKGWSLGGRLNAQYSEQPLVNNEQFVFGGADTVRGYLEAEELADAGLAGGIELRLPTWVRGALKGNLFFFTDHGVGITQLPLPGQPQRVYLDSVGGGFKFAVGSALDASVDWAMARHKGSKDSRTPVSTDPRFDFLVKYSF